MINVSDLKKDINPLAKYYSDFKVSERILLTGHSHQAQPDIAKQGLIECWDDASSLADDKWEKAFEKADIVRSYISKLINDDKDNIVLAQNTHDLIIRFLSSLNFKKRNKIITTDGEFHTIRRQLDRLNEVYFEIIKIERNPTDTLIERLKKEIDDNTLAVMLSKVMFQDSMIIENTGILENICEMHGAKLLVDIYHVLNVLPFDIIKEGLQNSFLVGGGYKYLQFGEGNCFMRIPEDEQYRPVITGWFSEFAGLSENKKREEVSYGKKRWAFEGSTYDPASNYRAVKVINFFSENKLNIELLHQINLHQKNVLFEEFAKYDFNREIIYPVCKDLKKTAGFVTFRTKYSGNISKKLKSHNIFTDYRGEHLRFGPAPYLTDGQLRDSIAALFKSVINL